MRILIATLIFMAIGSTELLAGDIGHGGPSSDTPNVVEDQSWWEELLSPEESDN